MKTSSLLEVGAVYSRKDLMRMFEISDATINTGIFQPKGHTSVWLFITEQKTCDRTPYVDMLEGDTLRWQGQLRGRKDDLIIEHVERGLELLVFYRETKGEYDGYAFRYEGPFSYESHTGTQPASFVLSRV